MRVEDKAYSLIQNTSKQRRKAPCVAMDRSSAEMCHGLERSKFANKKQQDIFKAAVSVLIFGSASTGPR